MYGMVETTIATSQREYNTELRVPHTVANTQNINELVDEFHKLDTKMKSIFPKVDPLLVLRLIHDGQIRPKPIYTVEAIIKQGSNTDEIREQILEMTGMAPSFYLHGTKIIVTHELDLELLKYINDREYVIEIKGNPYGAGGSTDF